MQDRLNGEDRELNTNHNDSGTDNFSEGKKDYENNQNSKEKF